MQLHQQLNQLSRKLRQLDQNTSELYLSSARLTTLHLIKQHNPVTLKELATIQSVALPTMSKIVDELQKRALVIRAQSKDDARQRWIVPTQKGIQTLQKSELQSQQFWQKKLHKLSSAQIEQLGQSLDLLLAEL
jgi:DNA-binding MarR family transcriptional regulator